MVNFITSSRKPGTNARVFTKELAPIINAEYITRGKASISELIESARYNGVDKLFIVTEKAGNPKQILEVEVDAKTWKFSNTFFVVLHNLRKAYTKENYKIKSVRFDEVSKPLHHLLRDANVYSDDESEFNLIENNGVASIYTKDKEIGPKFKIEYKE